MDVGARELVFLVGVGLLAGGLAAILATRLARLVAVKLENVPYRALCGSVLVLVSGLVFLYSGPVGLLVFGTSTAIGMLPAYVPVKRTHCMGVIMLPCILYFAGAKSGVLSALGL
jgi:putative membrane protein